MGIKRTFVRYRYGEASATDPFVGWLDIYNRSIGAVAGANSIRSTSGQIDLAPTSTEQAGDWLVDQGDKKIYFVVQVSPLVGKHRLLVAQVSPPIPDEFESGVIEAFWAVSGQWDINVQAGRLSSTPSTVSAYLRPNLLDIPFTYQIISGDFDVYSYVTVEKATGGALKHALIKAESKNGSNAVGVGVRANDLYLTVFREDYLIARSVQDADKVPLGEFVWLRLARVGQRFFAAYSTLSSKQRPIRESDWTEIVGVDVFTSSAEILLGMGFYNDTTGKVEAAEFDFFRNWTPLQK